ncbi:MAG TPA: acyltransferase [Candidatus Acidoferrum sp.]|nr:acyltransferase [Candidatus Acidoferrum sp.]
MGKLIYKSVESVVSRLKGRPYALDRSVPLSLLLGVLIRRFTWLLRGFIKGLLLQRRIVLVFMASAVNLRNATLIRFGRGVTLERGVIIDGLMRGGIVLGDHVMIGPYSVLTGASVANLGEGIRMGANSAVNAYSFLGSSGPISIGENVIMGQHVCFHPENHNFARTDVPIRSQGTTRLGITIEDDVWVGSNATFLDGAHVGRGSVIGAGAVVRGTIPPYSIAVGVPARVIRSRKSACAGNSDAGKGVAD